jgi:energy-converting hydrogenase Eha subunit C
MLLGELACDYIQALRFPFCASRGGTVETVELRPMSLGELLDRTFSLYRRHFWLFAGIMAIPSAFSIPMNFLLLSFQGSTLMSARTQVAPSPRLMLGVFAGYFVFLMIFWIVYSVAMAAATHAVAEAYLGRASTVRDSYKRIGGKFWRLMGIIFNIALRLLGIFAIVAMVAGGGGALVVFGVSGSGVRTNPVFGAIMVLLVFLVYMAGIAFCVYFALRYTVSIPALMIENQGALTAIRRSVQLTRGRRGHIFLALFLAAIIGYIGVVVFQVPFMVANFMALASGHFSTWLAFASSLSGAVGGSITGPISMIVIVLCYYDTRIRKEAFDLQFMMSSLDRPAPAAGTGTVSPA